MPLADRMAIFRAIDEDGSGAIDVYEWVFELKDTTDPTFLRWMAATLAKAAKEEAATAVGDDEPDPELQAALERQAEADAQMREQLRGLFAWIDLDGGGSISAAELTGAVRRGPKCALRRNLAQVLKMFARMDVDGSGDLDETEFVEAMMATEDPVTQSWLLMMLTKLASGNLDDSSRGKSVMVSRRRLSGLTSAEKMSVSAANSSWGPRLQLGAAPPSRSSGLALGVGGAASGGAVEQRARRNSRAAAAAFASGGRKHRARSASVLVHSPGGSLGTPGARDRARRLGRKL